MDFFKERSMYYECDNSLIDSPREGLQKTIGKNITIVEDLILNYFEDYKGLDVSSFKVCLESMINVRLKNHTDLRAIPCESNDTILYYDGKTLICVVRYSDYELLEKGDWYQSLSEIK